MENGRFRFKETVMTGDPLGRGGELRKVLGLRWDTEEDKICVDMKLSGRVAELWGEGERSVHRRRCPADDPESALPNRVTRRILWRVAQSQYDPLGLLRVYSIW